ncbi:hypothetical protein ACEPAH_9294 [Sanghuangporus vaninii]
MRFRAPDYYDSDSESESESESLPAAAASSAQPTPLTANSTSTSTARIRELHILTKKKQAKHKRRGKDRKIVGMKRFDVYRDAYLARRRGRHGAGTGAGPGPTELGREEERTSEQPERAFRESTAEAAVKIENPLACGLERVFDDFVRRLAGGSGSGAAKGSPSSCSCIAPGAFPGLSMIDSDND